MCQEKETLNFRRDNIDYVLLREEVEFNVGIIDFTRIEGDMLQPFHTTEAIYTPFSPPRMNYSKHKPISFSQRHTNPLSSHPTSPSPVHKPQTPPPKPLKQSERVPRKNK